MAVLKSTAICCHRPTVSASFLNNWVDLPSAPMPRSNFRTSTALFLATTGLAMGVVGCGKAPEGGERNPALKEPPGAPALPSQEKPKSHAGDEGGEGGEG